VLVFTELFVVGTDKYHIPGARFTKNFMSYLWHHSMPDLHWAYELRAINKKIITLNSRKTYAT